MCIPHHDSMLIPPPFYLSINACFPRALDWAEPANCEEDIFLKSDKERVPIEYNSSDSPFNAGF